MPKVQFVVLGAGRPTGVGVPSQTKDGVTIGSSLRWLEAAARPHVEVCHFVAGFALEQTAAHLQGFNIEYNPHWDTTGSAASLLCAPVPADWHALVCYADVVFRESIVARLVADSADIAVAIDGQWRERYAGRTHRDLNNAEKVMVADGILTAIGRDIAVEAASAEFVGLVRLSPAAMACARDPSIIPEELREKGALGELISLLARRNDLSVSLHDVDGDWAELNAPQDLSRFILGTKAETLERLRPLVRRMQVKEQVRFTVSQWMAEPHRILDTVAATFPNTSLIVRSSARSEDGWKTANAGAYASVPHVPAADREDLSNAISTVIRSYGEKRDQDQVLIQPMVTNVVANGVLFTRTLSHGAPYFVLNFDETSGCTDAVTAGRGELKVLYIHHEAEAPPVDAPAWVRPLIDGAREVIDLVGYDTLDLEFVIDADGAAHLLQLRPIAVDHSSWIIDDALIRTELREAQARFLAAGETGVSGGCRNVFGVMPDWNPAEIIGTRPSLLSTSLYRYLICDEVWAQQRAEYGYCDVRPQPLLMSFAGHPYVNVRASFRSFVPATLPPPLADRLVEHYLARLVAEPELHDKIEFGIAFTCLSFDFHDRAKSELIPAGFTENEIEALRAALAHLTRAGITRYRGDLAAIAELKLRYQAIMAKQLPPLERACVLLDDCRRFGTLPFAHLARGAFIAVTLLRSAVRRGLIDQSFFDDYLNSISTVAKEFVRDSADVSAGKLNWDTLLDRYGHLRPGTYDILTPTYRENDGCLLREAVGSASKGTMDSVGAVEWPQGAWSRIEAALAELGIHVDATTFDQFLRRTIEGRELAKFEFSRNLSQALDDLAAYGRRFGLAREDLAAVPIESYFALRAGEGFGDPGRFIRRMAEFYEPRRRLARAVELPPLIHDPGQFFAFVHPPSQPNFVTSLAITGEACFLSGEGGMAGRNPRGRIVMISQADPGFDWLFGAGLAGLITEYGGANSHVAIRAAEFGVPAAIGVGPVAFERLRGASTIRLDCMNRRIEIVR